MKQHERVVLFDGKGLDNWKREDGGRPEWKLEDGTMTVVDHDIMSKETFGDAVIHVEFRVPYMPDAQGQWRGNSGVFLQGMYEIQVLDSYGVNIPGTGDCGAFYQMHAPLINACKAPLEWQSYDIFFRAARPDQSGEGRVPARVTILQNGILIHNNIELPKHTGNRIRGGFDPDPCTPGPLLLQCHAEGDPVSYRNIWIEHLPFEGSTQYGPG